MNKLNILDDNGRIKLIEDKKTSKKDKANSDDELRRPAKYNNDYEENGYESDNSPRTGKKKTSNKKVERLNFDENEDDVTTIRKPVIVTAYDSEEERRVNEERKPQSQLKVNNNKENVGPSSLMEKKRLKWQADRQSQDHLQQQELYDRQKFNQSESLSAIILKHFFKIIF